MQRRIYFDEYGKRHLLPPGRKPKKRPTVYGIVLDKNKILAFFVSRFNFFHLPGGGKEKGETDEQALKREFFEEMHCRIKLLQRKPFCKYGLRIYALDYKDYFDHQAKYYFVQIVGSIGKCEYPARFVPLGRLRSRKLNYLHWKALEKLRKKQSMLR